MWCGYTDVYKVTFLIVLKFRPERPCPISDSKTGNGWRSSILAAHTTKSNSFYESTVEPRYFELCNFESPAISKSSWPSLGANSVISKSHYFKLFFMSYSMRLQDNGCDYILCEWIVKLLCCSMYTAWFSASDTRVFLFLGMMQAPLQAHKLLQEVWNARVSNFQERSGFGLLPELDLVSMCIEYVLNVLFGW